MPDDDSWERKHVALCYTTCDCCVGMGILFVYDLEKHNWLYKNKICKDINH
jgi:hypothetical protein